MHVCGSIQEWLLMDDCNSMQELLRMYGYGSFCVSIVSMQQ